MRPVEPIAQRLRHELTTGAVTPHSRSTLKNLNYNHRK
jgi:hypothetical protein